MSVISSMTKFWIFTPSIILSILCSLFVLYHLLFDRTLRQSLNNHATIIILFVALVEEVIVIPLYLHYYLNEGTWIRSLTFCEILTFVDWSTYVIQSMLFAWANLEKHILIFHEHWVLTFKKRLFVHYFPFIFLLSYDLIFYFIFTFFPPCTNLLVQTSVYCTYTCMQDSYIYSMWEIIVHFGLPALVIICSSISLFVRVIRQKYRIHRHVQWRKHRKMAIQVLSISFLYLLFAFPFVVTSFMFEIGIWNSTISTVYSITNLISYFIYFLLPFVCALSIPNLKKKIRNLFCLPYGQRVIHPVPDR